MPNYSNADDVLATAISASGVATTVAILPYSNGEGAIASEIGMPNVQNIADTASILYDYSSSSFYPGVYAAQWNVDFNHFDFDQAMQQGNIVPPGCNPPSGCTATRIADFIDAFAPIPGSSQFLAAGDVLNSGADNDREIYWMNLSIALPCASDSYGYCNVEESSTKSGNDVCIVYINGRPVRENFPQTITDVYNIYNRSSLLETATETLTNNGQCPPSYSTRWSPNEPKTEYGDPNLP